MKKFFTGVLVVALLCISPAALAAPAAGSGSNDDEVEAGLEGFSAIEETEEVDDGVGEIISGVDEEALEEIEAEEVEEDAPDTEVSAVVVTPDEDIDAWVPDEVVEDVDAATEEEINDSILLQEFTVSSAEIDDITDEWIEDTLATYPEHTWAPLKWEPSDDQLNDIGLPSSDILLAQDYPEPTMIDAKGNTETVELPAIDQETGDAGPTVATVAGAGWFGIRPGAKVLLLNGGSIGWCTLAHVYGSPGNYSISTAGHCGKGGDTATMIAAFGSRDDVLHPILLDFGTFKSSTDGGLGNDKALISIDPEWQNLVTPTMAFWGGPRGMYTPTGTVAGVTFPRRGLVPSVTLDPDPTLAQAIVHYGHGTGIGAGGTPRAGTAIYWGIDHYMFEGIITFGDSGSGSNVIVGDTVGGSMEAAGINTHIWVDPLMRDGIGIMGGTRATQVSGTLANGQIVPYPVPITGAP